MIKPPFIDGFDLAFMMDASSSVGSFDLSKNFVTRIIQSTGHVKGVRYGLVLFGDSIKVKQALIILPVYLIISKLRFIRLIPFIFF